MNKWNSNNKCYHRTFAVNTSIWTLWENNLKTCKMLTHEHWVDGNRGRMWWMYVWCTTWNFPDWVPPYTCNWHLLTEAPPVASHSLINIHEFLNNLKQMKFQWHHLAVCHKILFVQDVLIIFYTPFLSTQRNLLGGITLYIQYYINIAVIQFC